MKPTILVTGGAGFIGFHLTKRLLEDENAVVLILDNFSNSKRDSDFSALLDQYPDRVSVLELDLLELDLFSSETNDIYRKALSEVKEIYHFAAIRSTKTSLYGLQDPYETLWKNIQSTRNLIDFVRRNWKDNPPRFLFASSGEVNAIDYVDYPITEDYKVGVPNTTDPRWTYSLSKIAGEMLVINSALPYVVARMQNPYGPRAGSDNVVPKIIQRILNGEKKIDITTPNDTRPFTYIDDVIDGLILLMKKGENGIYNVCSPLEIKIFDLANAIVVASASSDVEVVVAEKANMIPERRYFSTSKMQQLGWDPKDDLVDGLWKTFEWYKNNHESKN